MKRCNTGHYSTVAKHDNRMIKSTKIQRNTGREKCEDNRPRRLLPLFHFSVSQTSCHIWSSHLQQFSCLSISLYHCHATYFCWWQICFNCSSKHHDVSGKLSYRNKTSSNLRSHFNVKCYNIILAIQLWFQLILKSVCHSNPSFLQKKLQPQCEQICYQQKHQKMVAGYGFILELPTLFLPLFSVWYYPQHFPQSVQVIKQSCLF